MNRLNLKFEDKSFDVVVSFDVLGHVFDQTRFVAEIARALKPNSILIIGTPNAMLSYGANPYPVKELSLKEFRFTS